MGGSGGSDESLWARPLHIYIVSGIEIRLSYAFRCIITKEPWTLRIHIYQFHSGLLYFTRFIIE